jgi:hypothetical protein
MPQVLSAWGFRQGRHKQEADRGKTEQLRGLLQIMSQGLRA